MNTSEELKLILDSHARVGQKKPVSYVPIRTVESVIGISVQEYVLIIESMGNSGIILGAEECCINSGAVYAYSPRHLDQFLKEDEAILAAHGWPTVPLEFIKRIAAEWLEETHPIMPVIRKAFGGG